jgi:hypothetical protein
MPSLERFQARPPWACLEPCPGVKITSFVEDSSRSRKSVVPLEHMRIFRVVPIEALATGNCKRHFAAWRCQGRHVPEVKERRKLSLVVAALSTVLLGQPGRNLGDNDDTTRQLSGRLVPP